MATTLRFYVFEDFFEVVGELPIGEWRHKYVTCLEKFLLWSRRTTQWGLATPPTLGVELDFARRRTTHRGMAMQTPKPLQGPAPVGELPNGDWRWLLTRANFNKLSKGDKEFSKICGKHESRIIKNLKLRSDSPCKISQSRR